MPAIATGSERLLKEAQRNGSWFSWQIVMSELADKEKGQGAIYSGISEIEVVEK